MLSTITIITFTVFAALYPFSFWISADDPLKNGFLRFHLSLPASIATVLTVFLFSNPVFVSVRYFFLIWSIISLLVTFIYWNKEFVNPFIVSVPALIGLLAFFKVHLLFFGYTLGGVLISILAGAILSISIYAMNLGHWYLNVHGLPLKHLKRSMYIFWILLLFRFVWDVYAGLTQTVTYSNGFITAKVYNFVATTDGVLLLLGLFFGVLFPLCTLYFVKGTLDVKNTQSATGILYVILSALLIGELTYKYYFIKFGIVL